MMCQRAGKLFLSTLSLRRATSPPSVTPAASRNFYPRSPCGERPDTSNTVCNVISISIHALLAESDTDMAKRLTEFRISIHALLAESDHAPNHSLCLHSNFYPRSPCGERHCSFGNPYKKPYFYPRSPCGERREKPRQTRTDTNFYPRSPCGERPSNGGDHYSYIRISIHALLAESDTKFLTICQERQAISIHALLAESDSQQPDGTTKTTYFYPRSPCGERR